MEEVTKMEPMEPPVMRITDVQTVKIERPENSTSFLKVRTPTSINNGTTSSSLKMTPGKVLIKRLGSTTIRSLPSANLKLAAKAQLVKMANGSYQTHPAYTNPPRIPLPSPQSSSPKSNPTLYRAPPDPRDDIIRQLQEQNREMKKMLLECRREASQVQTKMRRWTVTINEVLGRVQKLQAPGTYRAVPSKPTVVSGHPPPLPPSPTVTTLMKVTARKSTSLPSPQPPIASDIIFRSPAFPIKTFSSLKSFENDLRNREFFDFVGQKLMITINKFKIEKPAALLAYVLQTLLNTSLLSIMVWEQTETTEPKRLALVNFKRIRELYSRLVNNMSKGLYGKNLDPAAVERFLRSKLYPDTKERQQPTKLKNQNSVVRRIASAAIELKKQLEENEQKPRDQEEVEWVDVKVGEDCEQGNEILGDSNSQNESDQSEGREAEEKDKDDEQHPESSETNDFHFMDFEG
jgi:hypothetical protein